MNNPIKLIVQFNQNAGLLENGYDDFLESSFQIEEALEGFNLKDMDTEFSSSGLTYPDASPKSVSRNIVSAVVTKLSDVDRLDKACDAVVFAIGSMAKLGLNAQQITKALNVVMYHNNAKLAMPKDEHGKLMKSPDFIGPEKELQKILDERN